MKIASSPTKITQNSHFRKGVSLTEQKAQLDDRFLRGRQNALIIYEYSRVTSAREAVPEHSDLFRITLHGDDVQEFDTRWDEVLLSIRQIPQTIFWKICTRCAYVALIKSKP